MLNNVPPLSPTPQKRRGVWPRAVFASMMLIPVVGCASQSRPTKYSSTLSEEHRKSDWYSPSANRPQKKIVNRTATANHSKTYAQTASMQRHFTEKAKKNELPDKYLSEARVGMTEVDTQLANARASELKRDATVRKENARITNRRINVAAKEETELAELDRLKKEQKGRQTDLVAELSARERQAKATVQKNSRMAEALAKEQRTIQQDMISRAERDFDESKAHVEELQVVRLATDKEGAASIAQARKTAEATRARAAATVAKLRQESRSVTSKTTARVAELYTQLATVPKQFQAKSTQLKSKATSTKDQARAKAAEMS